MQTNEKNKVDTMIFLLRFTCLPTRYVPIVSTAHLVVQRLIGITRQARTSGTARTYPESEGSSMTCSTRVALRGSRGASTMPLTKLFFGASHKLLVGSTETTTKPSRRWQPPRVTSTIGLQDDHLLFIAPRAKIAVTPSLGVFRVDRTRWSDRPDAPCQRPINGWLPHHPSLQMLSTQFQWLSHDRTQHSAKTGHTFVESDRL